jgi:hypothetical protein
MCGGTSVDVPNDGSCVMASGGVDSGVTYIAFTGSSAVVSKKEDHSEAVQIGQSLSSKLVQSN